MLLRTAVVLLIVVALSIPAGIDAIESGPSNTVGFWKMEVHPGFTQFSFPLLPNDRSLNNVLGDQLTGAAVSQQSDQILRWDAVNGRFEVAWYNTTSNSWQGEFNEVTEVESYWIYVQPDHPATQMIVTYGNVIEEPVYDMGEITEGYNAVGSVWAMPVPLTEAGLNGFEGGLYLFLSDLVMSYDASTGSFTYAWKDDVDNWQGTLTAFEPLKGYWIYIPPGHAGFDWTAYPQPDPSGLDSHSPEQIYPRFDGARHHPAPPMPATNQQQINQAGPIKTPSPAKSAKGGSK